MLITLLPLFRTQAGDSCDIQRQMHRSVVGSSTIRADVVVGSTSWTVEKASMEEAKRAGKPMSAQCLAGTGHDTP